MILCTDCTHYMKHGGYCERTATEYVRTSPFDGVARRGRHLPDSIDAVRSDPGRCGPDARWYEPRDRAREALETAGGLIVFVVLAAIALGLMAGAWKALAWLAS